MVRFSALAITLALIAAACGSDDDGSDATAAPAASAAPGTSGTTGTGGSASTSPASTEKVPTDPFKVQIVTSLTGVGSDNGIGAGSGFQTALEQLNADGGINGRKVKYDVIDDRSDASVAPASATQALSAEPIAILDGSNSGYLTARMPTYTSAKVPVFSTGPTAGPLQPWSFTNNVSFDQSAGVAVNAAKLLLGGVIQGKKVAAIGADNPGARGTVDAVKAKVAEAGGNLVSVEFQPLTGTSFTSGAANIVAAGAEVVLIFDTPNSTVIEAKALDQAGFKGPILGAFSSSSDAILESISLKQYRAVRQTKGSLPGTVMYEQAKKYGFEAGTKNAYFGSGWTLANAFIAGLKKCGPNCTAKTLIPAMESLGTFQIPGDAAFAPYVINPTQHHMNTAYYIYEWDLAAKKAVQYPNGLVETGPANLPKS